MARYKVKTWVPVLITVAILVLAVGAAMAQQARGRGRGGMAAFMYLDRSWVDVCFGVGATQAQIEKLFPTYQQAYQTRTQAIANAMGQQDRQAAMQQLQATMEQIQTDLQNKLKAVLNTDQQQKLDTLMNQGMMGRGGQRGGRRGGGGNWGGGGG